MCKLSPPTPLARRRKFYGGVGVGFRGSHGGNSFLANRRMRRGNVRRDRQNSADLSAVCRPRAKLHIDCSAQPVGLASRRAGRTDGPRRVSGVSTANVWRPLKSEAGRAAAVRLPKRIGPRGISRVCEHPLWEDGRATGTAREKCELVAGVAAATTPSAAVTAASAAAAVAITDTMGRGLSGAAVASPACTKHVRRHRQRRHLQQRKPLEHYRGER